MSTPDAAPSPDLPIETGARRVPDRATFEILARRDDVPGQLGAPEMKLLILAVDTAMPQLYFLNTNAFDYHYDFATRALGLEVELEDFNAVTYFRDDRSNLAATIIANDRFEPESPGGGEAGLYALEFWPTDPVRAKHIALAYELVGAAMPFAAAKLAYHPAGETQEALFAQDADVLRERRVRSISTAELYANVSFVALNPGEGFGVLSAVDPTSARPPTIRDVALFATLPNDLGHVAGVISATPQTPLSHINLKAKQNDTPNAYVRDAPADPRIAPLLGQVVRYEVTPQDLVLEAASPEQVAAWLQRIRPQQAQAPPRDLTLTQIADLDELGHGDVQRVGAKAAVQVGESLVTNPDPSATPDELLISAIGEHGEYETQYIRRSTLTAGGAPVMTAQQIGALTGLLATIQRRFAVLYDKRDDPGFAMDVEFKVDAAGALAIKQARPWVE